MNPSRLSFLAALVLIFSSPAALAAPPDEFGARFSGKAPAALGDDPDIFADFLAGYEPAAGGFVDLIQQEGEKKSAKPRNTYKPGSGGGFRAPRLTEDNSRYLVRKRSGE